MQNKTTGSHPTRSKYSKDSTTCLGKTYNEGYEGYPKICMPTCIGKPISFFGANNLKAVKVVCMAILENTNNNDDWIKRPKKKKRGIGKSTCDIQEQEKNHEHP